MTCLSLKLKIFVFRFFTIADKTATRATLKRLKRCNKGINFTLQRLVCGGNVRRMLPADAVKAKARLFENINSNPLRIA